MLHIRPLRPPIHHLLPRRPLSRRSLPLPRTTPFKPRTFTSFPDLLPLLSPSNLSPILQHLHLTLGIPYLALIPLFALTTRLLLGTPLLIISRLAANRRSLLLPLISAKSHIRVSALRNLPLPPQQWTEKAKTVRKEIKKELVTKWKCDWKRLNAPIFVMLPTWIWCSYGIRGLVGEVKDVAVAPDATAPTAEGVVQTVGESLSGGFIPALPSSTISSLSTTPGVPEALQDLLPLCATDSTMILPAIFATTSLANVVFNTATTPTPAGLSGTIIQRLMGLVSGWMFFVACAAPKVLVIYWATNSIVNLLQNVAMWRVLPKRKMVGGVKPKKWGEVGGEGREEKKGGFLGFLGRGKKKEEEVIGEEGLAGLLREKGEGKGMERLKVKENLGRKKLGKK